MGDRGAGGFRPSEWYLGVALGAVLRGAAPKAGRHWKGGAGCHTLPGGVGGLREASFHPLLLSGSVTLLPSKFFFYLSDICHIKPETSKIISLYLYALSFRYLNCLFQT